ncbi:7007_t:CDS:1, partial [Gigaspora rosea]
KPDLFWNLKKIIEVEFSISIKNSKDLVAIAKQSNTTTSDRY